MEKGTNLTLSAYGSHGNDDVMGEGYGEEGASTNGGESTCMGNSTAAGDCNINSEDLKVDVSLMF